MNKYIVYKVVEVNPCDAQVVNRAGESFACFQCKQYGGHLKAVDLEEAIKDILKQSEVSIFRRELPA